MKNSIKILLLLLSLNILASCNSKEEKAEKQAEARLKSMTIYEQRLQKWPVEYIERMVETRYGLSHVIESGAKDASPLVLIHAMGIGSTMWIPNIEALSQEYRVFAVDTIGDLNKSVLDSLDNYPKKGSEYSLWLTDVFDALEIEKAGLVAASMGGWIALNHAVYASERVNKLALLGPMGIASNVAEVGGKITSILFNPSDKNKRSMIAWALGENQRVLDEFADYMYIAVEAPGKMGFPNNLSSKELKGIHSPVLLILGGEDRPIGKPKKVQTRAEKYIPDLRTVVVEGSGHLMNIEEAEKINNLLLDFFKE